MCLLNRFKGIQFFAVTLLGQASLCDIDACGGRTTFCSHSALVFNPAGRAVQPYLCINTAACDLSCLTRLGSSLALDALSYLSPP